MQAQEYLMLLSKRNDLAPDTEGNSPDIRETHSSGHSSEVDEGSANMSHAQKLRKMHKAVTQILKKTQQTKEHLRNLRQEVEVTCEELKNEPEEPKNESNEIDISDISNPISENVWDELKTLELQVRLLKEKVKSGEESIKNRKKQGDEIKELIQELETLQSSRIQDKTCECKACIVI
jgi:chromosome segregation ATPase